MLREVGIPAMSVCPSLGSAATPTQHCGCRNHLWGGERCDVGKRVWQAGSKLIALPGGVGSGFPDSESCHNEPGGIVGVDSKTHSPLYLLLVLFSLDPPSRAQHLDASRSLGLCSGLSRLSRAPDPTSAQEVGE